MVFQHALQVSKPTPMGKLRGSGQGGSRSTNKGEVEGDLVRGSPGPHPGGSPGPHLGGMSILACTEADPTDGYGCGGYAS